MTALRHWTLSLFSLLFLLVGTHTHAGEYITFLHSDLQGSPIMATDEQGNVVWQEEYEPWGARQVKDSAAATAARGSKVWYTGKEEEAALGMYYYGARWYSPDTGQFASVDPMPVRLGNPRSFNRYVYANNNPIVYVDPDGRDAVSTARVLRAGILFDFAFPDPSDVAWPKILIEGGLLLGTNYIIDRAGNNYLNESAESDNGSGVGEKAVEGKGQTKPEVGTCPECAGSTTNKPGKIASDHDMTKKGVKEKIHELKGGAKIPNNPDVEVCRTCGEVFPQTSNGGLGDSIGNIREE